ncbi:MAG: hypothetical protein NUV91_08350 [Candidatus Omnitrophica bacterium]|nr:hypothetical protein [Candidatus Omnitrophota bacterium]
MKFDYTKLFPLPINASAHGHEIDFLIYLVHILMFLLFIGWGIYFIFVLIRFNRKANPKANYHGVHNKASTAIEAGVVIFEAVLLIGFSIPFWVKQVDALPKRPDTVEVRVVAEQFVWNIHYPGMDGVFGNTDMKYFDKVTNPLGIDPTDPNGKDDVTTINQLHLPIGRPALIYLSSKDVIHSFFLPIMRVKQDAIPGMVIPLWFVPTKTGQSEIACAQLCGLGHYYMRGYLTVHTPEEYDAWISEQSQNKDSGEEAEDDFWS